MQLSRSFFITIVLLFTLTCVGTDPLSSPDSSAITMNITLPRGETTVEMQSGLAKAVSITSVTVTVTASDMDDITESLTIGSGGETATGTVEVPKGDDRTFAVECRDGSNVLQYSGSTTQDINDDAETVSITTEGHYPTASTLTITDYGATSVTLSWDRNTDPDFASYEIVRASSATDITSSSTRTSLTTISTQSTTSYVDATVSASTTYYYAVIVWDTEGMGMRSGAESVETPAAVIYQEFSDEGPWEIPDNDYIARYFTDNTFAPVNAVVDSVKYRLRVSPTGDPEDYGNFWCGDYQIYIYSSYTTTHEEDDLVYDNLGGWSDDGYDDDIDDDYDIYLNWRKSTHFNGEYANQYWGIYIVDNYLGDSGELDYIQFRIYYSAGAQSPGWKGDRTGTDGFNGDTSEGVISLRIPAGTTAGATGAGASSGISIEKVRF
ncbi:MAG: hypothetical protein JSW54_01850 [Fidelibacterota bacterium]|nr:MAG: hypothetical protein JSW54_01850 [Candidatus Neomarinimicrobiota bacterium]